jgi:hypothetical protein
MQDDQTLMDETELQLLPEHCSALNTRRLLTIQCGVLGGGLVGALTMRKPITQARWRSALHALGIELRAAS